MTPTPKQAEMAALLRAAVQRYNALSAEERHRLKRLQRESFIRGMTTPCEHGVLDFEQCGECRAQAAQNLSAQGEEE